MKRIFILPLFLTGIFLFTEPINAVVIGYYPGLKKMIDQSDAIVILRIDRDLSGYDSPTLYSTHECYIYQTLKGKIPKNTRINLQLRDTQAYFATPYAHGSTHLMFLIKKRTDDEPTEYRTIDRQGAHFRLPPFGNEKAPEGKTIEEKIRNLINKAISYEAEEHEKKEKYLRSLLTINESTDLSIINEEKNLVNSLIGTWIKEYTNLEGGNYPGDKDWELKVTFDENGRFVWDSKRKDQDGNMINGSVSGTYSIENGFTVRYLFDKSSKQSMEKVAELFAFWQNQMLGLQTFKFNDENLVLGHDGHKIWIYLRRKK